MRIYILFLIFLIFSYSLNAVVVGSNTTVSRQSLINFPAADSDNEIRGFASFEQGFKLENNTASCIYNAYFPIGGTMTLNGGTLNLSRDVIFEADFKTVGTINANNYAFNFTTTAPVVLPSGTVSGGGEEFSFIDNKVLPDRVNSVDWSYDDAEIAAGDERGATANLTAFSFDGSALTQKDQELVVPEEKIKRLRWRPVSTRHVAVATRKKDSDHGLQIWEYNQGTTSLSRTENEDVGGDEVKAVAWNRTGMYVAMGQKNSLKVYSFNAGSGTLSLVDSIGAGGKLKSVSWDDSGSYIVIGTDSSPQLSVYSFNGSSLSLDASQSIGDDVQAVDWSASGDYLAVGIKGGSSNLRVFSHSPGSLSQLTSVSENADVETVHWNSDASYLAVGLEQSSNSEVRIYEFDSGSSTLTLKYELDVSDDVKDIRWSHDDQYLAWADKNNEVNVYKLVSTSAGGDDILRFVDTKITFNSDVLLKKTTQFQGVCAIRGNGHALDLGTTGNVIVATGASLLLQDLTLENITSNNMRCLDSLSTVSLCDVTWMQESDYTFTVGHIDIVGDVTITGTNIFNYQSSSISTIASHAKLMFDVGMTFKYDPPTSDRDLFAMTDKTSVLHLYEATLYATIVGWELTKGTLIVEGTCPVESEATQESEGIVFGDGISVINDLAIKTLPESGLDLKSGFLVCKNIAG